ncbi:MAG: MFS transporter [Collinsella phocaeensis]
MFKGAVLRYLISDALSMLGNSIAGVVLPLVLLARTGDVLAAGSLALICAVPQFVFGLLGGAVFDRVDRKLVCVVSDLVSALSIALLPIVDEVWGLSFGWFVALGLLGAVGDVPGMTARDALLPAVCRHEGVDLQRFVGASQSLASLTTIAGPAAAALLMGALGDIDALWVTAACSCLASAVSATLPREVGAVSAAVPADTADASADSAPTGFSALAAASSRRCWDSSPSTAYPTSVAARRWAH